MWSRTAPTTAGFLLFAISNATAQRDTLASSRSESRDRVSIVAGFADAQRRDVVVSPLTYLGSGYAASAAYDHFGARSAVAVVATWDAQSLRPQSNVNESTERVMQGGLRAAALRTVADAYGWSFSAGATAGLWGMATEHRYPAPYDSRAGFFAAFAAAGPAAQARRPILGGLAQLEVDAPVFGFSNRAYSETKTGQPLWNVQRVGPRELRALDGALTYAPAPLGRVGLLFSYRFSILDYRDAQPLRSASQSFSIGLSRAFGAYRPR
ncbi:MAG TPA: hypothetical protein VGQ44_19890 [Gemmatimonadaceae bacterium]|jgi:hypothetical protein|nr:hypothetical protein [Gemmatimonadaceae bacterium]